MRPYFLPLPLALLSLASPGQTPPPTAAIAATPTRVLIDQPGDGDVWVLARGYKARFGRDGVDFIPFYGPRAARNHPVSFRLRAVERGQADLAWHRDVAPTVDGQRVTYDRGAVREVWHLRDGEVEQTFVVAASAASGDLTVRVDVRAEAPCRDLAGGGLAFVHAGAGTVTYGDLVALGDGGARLAAPSRWTGDGIELRVPAAFADAQRGAITVDPVVRAIPVAEVADDDIEADVAYEPGTDRWLVVFERAFSARDSDILARRYNGDGGLIEEVAVATGTRESHRPAVAANSVARQFLVVWDEDSGVSDRVVLGRTRAAGGTGQGTTFTIRDTSGITSRDLNPAVGGSTATDAQATFYLVASELHISGVPSNIQLTRVTTAGTINGFAPAGAGAEQATDPAVTKARPTDGRWLLAYRAQGNILAEAHAGINNRGVAQIVDNVGIDVGPPAVAGDGTQFVVIYSARENIGDNDLQLAHLRFTRNLLGLVSRRNITAQEPRAVVANDQIDPAIAFDGCRVTYVYAESTGVAGNYEPYAAVVQLEPALSFSDSHRLLFSTQTPNQIDRRLVMASEGEMGGDAGRHFVAWEFERTTVNRDVRGCLFDGTAIGNAITFLPTACGNVFAPTLTVQNTPALGATLRLRATAIQPQSQLFLIGLPVTPITLCGAGCKLGVLPILITVPGTSVDLPIGCDVGLIGARLAVQNLMLGGPLGCTTASFPVAFNISDTVVIAVQ